MFTAKIKKVISHPHATAQCKNYITTYLKGAEIVAANSTAEAIKILKEQENGIAAIGTKTAARIYGLKIIESDIEDNKDNKTTERVQNFLIDLFAKMEY